MPRLPAMAPESRLNGADGRSTSTPVSVSASDLRRVLRDRQKARNRISCLPCRERKVRCNREHPCLTCIKRDHADLCIYTDAPFPARLSSVQPVPAVSTTPPASLASTAFRHAEPPNRQSPSLDHQQRPLDGAYAQPTQDSPSSSSGMPLLGGGSLLAIAREHDSETNGVDDDAGRGDVLENAVMPLLGVPGMDNNSRPGTSLQGDDLYADLPRDRELLDLFSIYRTRVHPFQLILADIEAVESELCAIINRRARSRGLSGADAQNAATVPVRRQFLCLVHAILATSGQFSDLSASDRSNISRRHVRCAFQMLMAENYLLQPFHEGAAWILSGSTIRMAISLGIHAASSCPKLGPPPVPAETARSIRLAIVWQDALLSLAFNRPPASHDMDSVQDLPVLDQRMDDGPMGLSYGHAMNWLCHLTLKHWQYAVSRPGDRAMDRYTNLFSDMDALEGALQDHLRSRDACHSIQAIQELYSFEVNMNFTISTFCRPILSKDGLQGLTKAEAELVLARLQDSLKRSVKAFIRTRSVTGYASRSWAFVHNGLTSALLLSFVKETRNEDESRQIQDELIKSLAEGDGILASESGASSGGDCARQMTIAHRKSLKALKALRKISEEERQRTVRPGLRGQPDTETGEDPMDCPENLAFAGNAMGMYQDPGTIEFDELLRSFDFGSALPIEAFDYITFDPMAPSF
ncbi:c6 zinc finger domain containing protein [Grosmannia clavigera kw1407]|uniref:C6 zinc finger domain containing protein n=1 Tax=Grosmannia clavigera (strain kw1407 / UAMH 11150) TaxID=655863 RepID=F0XL99_GROCL|nr:c6 zinc finger domain containing protein [Grosmannia clavigera kw1407]EFX01147.1 c6 zinc finger domain containing protein [Grosmannia clavigera kw1407]